MINTSNEFKKYMFEDRRFTLKATLTLADGTVLNLDDDDIMQNGMKFTDSTTDNGVFEIGAAIINSHTLTLNNFENKFSKYDFTDAVIIPYVGLELSETIEYLLKGIYTVDTAQAVGNTIILNTLDNMNKFDTAFSDVTVTFPCTALRLLQTVCTYCGVSLATTSFLNSNYVISTRPTDEVITCREIISWIAQISGSFARINRYGSLELKWYDIETLEKELNIDGGTFDVTTEISYQTGDSIDGGDFSFSETTNYDGGTFLDMNKFHHIYDLFSSEIFTDDVVITGIQVIDTADEPSSVLYGTTGYVLSIESNYLIQNSVQARTIANSVGAKIVGMRFRPYNVTALSDPRIEAGDITKLSDLHNNVYMSLVTNIVYTVGNSETIVCDAETPSKNSSVKYSEATKAIIEARKNTKQQISNYDLEMQRLTNLISNGFGLYKIEEIQPDGSKKYFMCDKPTKAQSSKVWTYTSEGLMISNNGGTTWAVDTNGNMLVNVLTAVGINADWINVLNTIYIGTKFSITADGVVTARNINAVNGNFSGDINGSTISGSTFKNIDSTNGEVATINNGAFKGTVFASHSYSDVINNNIGMQYGILRPGKLAICDSNQNTTMINGSNINTSTINCGTVNGGYPITDGNYTLYCATKNHSHSYSTSDIIPTYTSGGNIYFKGSSNNAASVDWCNGKFAINSSSDLRLKKNIKSLDDIPIELFMEIKTKMYEFRIDNDYYSKGIHFGVIAQEIESLFSKYGLNPYDYNLIELRDIRGLTDESFYVDDKVHVVNYDNFIAWGMSVTQKLYRQNLEQENKIYKLEDRLNKLEERI